MFLMISDIVLGSTNTRLCTFCVSEFEWVILREFGRKRHKGKMVVRPGEVHCRDQEDGVLDLCQEALV